MRTTIRRRIVSKMALVASKNYDRWYMFAHSLGTIPAFNALQEIELTLPNYLTEEEWNALPQDFKTSAPFVPDPKDPPTTENMMPRRPPWLKDSDGVDRRKLFERFQGFVTYGSPLDKFAALWPRVVCLNRQAAVFPTKCEWVNLHDPTDPVSARLDAYKAPSNQADKVEDGKVADRIVLEPKNFASRSSLMFGVSHICYFRPRAKAPTSMPAAIVGAIVSCGRNKLSEEAAKAAMPAAESVLRALAAAVQLAAVGAALMLAAAALLLQIGQLLPHQAVIWVKAVLDVVRPGLFEILQAGGWAAMLAAAAILFVLAVLAIAISGLARIRLDARRRRERQKREAERNRLLAEIQG